MTNYLSALNKEIELRGRLFNGDRLVEKIQFGGGSPSFLSTEQITDILDQIASQFHLDVPGNIEMGIELDPLYITPPQILSLMKLGFNQFSIHVLDFTPEVEAAIDFEQKEKNTFTVVRHAMEAGAKITVNLFRGLPYQSVDSFNNTLQKVVASGVSRIAVNDFIFTSDCPRTPQTKLDKNSIPNPETLLSLDTLARSTLLEAGYAHIGMGHFVLPQDPLSVALCSNALKLDLGGFTAQNDTDRVGLGVGAISKFDTAYAQNESSLTRYEEMLNSNNLPISSGLVLSLDDRLRANVIEQIMCRHCVDLSQTISAYGARESQRRMLDYFKSEMQSLANFVNDGLITPTPIGFDITEEGRYFAAFIVSVFDRHLRSKNYSDNVVQLSRQD